MNSKRFTLSKADIAVWTKNTVTFLAPLGVLYFGALAFVLQQPNHAFSVSDFRPSSFTLGGMVLYVVNTLFDLSRKYVGGK